MYFTVMVRELEKNTCAAYYKSYQNKESTSTVMLFVFNNSNMFNCLCSTTYRPTGCP